MSGAGFMCRYHIVEAVSEGEGHLENIFRDSVIDLRVLDYDTHEVRIIFLRK